MAEEEKPVKKRKGGPAETLFKKGNKCGGHPLGVPNYRANFRRKLEQFSTWKAPDAIIAQIKNALPKIPNSATIDDIEAARIHLAAMMGESWAIERLHGRADQVIDITTNGESITQTKFDFTGIDPDQLRGIRDTLIKAKIKNEPATSV